MSEERQLGYSRRGLRPSRQTLSDGGEQPERSPSRRGPGRRRAADSPVDARPERIRGQQPLTRARERESLRVHKALAEEGSQRPPQARTRRQLRQQQLESGRRSTGSSTSTAERARADSLSAEETRAEGSAEQNQQRKPPTRDPAAVHNLAMVTPLEFVEVPGQEFPVMKPPSTFHVPVVTGAPAHRSPRRSRSATAEPQGDILPVSANAAHGLEPLDRRTAGLALISGFTIIQMLLVAIGAVAVTVGLIMISGG